MRRGWVVLILALASWAVAIALIWFAWSLLT
jgi:hypothetical protein